MSRIKGNPVRNSSGASNPVAKQQGIISNGVKGSFRFAKKERINQAQDFRRALKFGRRISSQNFILFSRRNENTFHRLGIVVKKEIGPAIFRNRMKRYIREFFRLHKHQIRGSNDIILMVKKGCSLHRYQEAEEELRGLFIL